MQPKNNNNEKEFEEKIGLNFNNKSILHIAFIHRSYVNENPKEKENNERLEFLGDAILEFVVSENLFLKFDKQNEGHLTALRARLVNTESLALVAKDLNLGNLLYLSKGEEKGGGRTNSSLLANTVESLIGAIYLDQGIEKAKVFIDQNIMSRLSEVVKKSLKDPKSLLQEYVQAKGYPAPFYKTISEEGPDHAKEFTVEVIVGKKSFGKGVGNNKQIAAQEAAEQALKSWINNKD